jgi:hypothetical protein
LSVPEDLVDEGSGGGGRDVCGPRVLVRELGSFVCITNIGTSERIFNIAEVFSYFHRLLRPGAVVLHVLPCCGDLNHGFYSVHRTLFDTPH